MIINYYLLVKQTILFVSLQILHMITYNQLFFNSKKLGRSFEVFQISSHNKLCSACAFMSPTQKMSQIMTIVLRIINDNRKHVLKIIPIEIIQ